MTLDIWFWVIMVAVVLWSIAWGMHRTNWTWQGPFGSVIIFFLLLAMLGWRTFGPVVR